MHEEREPERADFVEDDMTVATVTYDRDRGEWVAESEGQSRVCPTFHEAKRFVEAVREPETVVRRLRTR